jgi:hypothetical protein
MIPQDAVEEITEHWDNGTKKSAFYYLDGEKIGYRYWDEDERLLMEYDIKGNLRMALFGDGTKTACYAKSPSMLRVKNMVLPSNMITRAT